MASSRPSSPRSVIRRIERLAAPDVVVQRRGLHADRAGQPDERDGLEPSVVRQLLRRRHDLLGVESLPRHLQLTRRIAASIAGGRRLEHAPVPGGEPRGLEGAQLAGARDHRRAVPRSHDDEREARVGARRRLDAAQRREHVAAEQRVVTRVAEGDVARRVAGARDHLERSDPVALRDSAGGTGVRPAVVAAELRLRLAGIERHVLRHQPGVALGDDDLDLGQLCLQPIQSADVIAVGMGERDPLDRRAGLTRRGEDLPGATRHRRVDEGEPVRLPHEVGVHESPEVDADEVRHRMLHFYDQ